MEDAGGQPTLCWMLAEWAVRGQPTLLEIRRRFGERVARIVEGCNDTDVVPKPP